jgi:hypothetical protein
LVIENALPKPVPPCLATTHSNFYRRGRRTGAFRL